MTHYETLIAEVVDMHILNAALDISDNCTYSNTEHTNE